MSSGTERTGKYFGTQERVEALEELEQVQEKLKTKKTANEESVLFVGLNLTLFLFFIAVKAGIPLFLKNCLEIGPSGEKFYPFSIPVILCCSNAIGATVTLIFIGFENPFKEIQMKTLLKLCLVRFLHDFSLALEPRALQYVSVATKSVFNGLSLAMIAGLRFAIFRATLSKTQLLLMLLIVSLVVAHDGNTIQGLQYKGQKTKSGEATNLLLGVGIILGCTAAQCIQRVIAEQVLKEDLKEISIWKKLCAGQILDIPIFIIWALILDFPIITGDSGPFTGISWKAIPVIPCSIFLVFCIYNILERLDALYLSFGGMLASMLAIVGEIFFFGENLILFKLIIAFCLVGLIAAYELESVHTKFLGLLLAKENLNDQQTALIRIIQGKTAPKFTSRRQRLNNDIFGSLTNISEGNSPPTTPICVEDPDIPNPGALRRFGSGQSDATLPEYGIVAQDDTFFELYRDTRWLNKLTFA